MGQRPRAHPGLWLPYLTGFLEIGGIPLYHHVWLLEWGKWWNVQWNSNFYNIFRGPNIIDSLILHWLNPFFRLQTDGFPCHCWWLTVKPNHSKFTQVPTPNLESSWIPIFSRQRSCFFIPESPRVPGQKFALLVEAFIIRQALKTTRGQAWKKRSSDPAGGVEMIDNWCVIVCNWVIGIWLTTTCDHEKAGVGVIEVIGSRNMSKLLCNHTKSFDEHAKDMLRI